MAPIFSKKRKVEDGIRGKVVRPKKRVRKQREYHSSSEDSEDMSEPEFAQVNLANSDDEEEIKTGHTRSGGDVTDASTTGRSSDSEDVSSLNEDGQNLGKRKKAISKRNDPDAFSTSISKILSTKLSQEARKDPVLSRSREAAEVSSGIANEKLEKRAKAKLRADRKEDLERGRVKDVLGVQSGSTGEVAEEEKRLRKIAQRGVVKLFNAVRAAQVKGEEAAREARKKGVVGYANKEEKVNEMSKQGFLDLINGNGKTKAVEEAR
jgi:Rrp15p